MKNVRLPHYIKPEKYQLTLKPDLNEFTFSGEETIFLTLEKSVSEITLHAKELEVENVELKMQNAKFPVGKKNIRYDVKSDTVTLKFSSKVPKGKAQLKISFTGILNNTMRGFYRSRYMHNGKEKHMATTQFEATDARRAFPCFDEPSQKAIFDVTLIVPKDLTAISNTIESSISEHESGYKMVKFQPTPKMSTYLLAFIIGDFESIEAKTKDGVLVRVFVTPGKKHQAKFALDTAVKCLEFYNKYFDIPYPLPVMDLIAIPDFSHGAMENWGAVTYRESALLVDPEHSSAANKQWVALVIAHELAHQWFGNLVTMEWWTHLWLNEGFASYIEYLAVNELFPKWDIWTQFAYADLGVALRLDALKHTHPIEIEVGHPDEIGEIFDEISYSKGASVIRMLAGYLGEKDFRDGLRFYLKKHSYKNASTVHLWEAFEKVSKKPVRKIMQNWTAKPGYPVLKLSELPGQLKLTQRRFFSSPLSAKADRGNIVWQVPVSVQASTGGKVGQYLLEKGQKLFNVRSTDKLKLNAGETGFYRVHYPLQMLANLQSSIKNKKLLAIDRLGLVRDAFALAEAGESPTAQALELIKAYENETDYTVWVELVSGLSNVKDLLYGQKAYPAFEIFGLKILGKIGKQVGWQAKKGEAHTQGLLRSLILGRLIAFNDSATITKGLAIFKKSKSVPADIRAAAYHAVAQKGRAKDHRTFINRYKTESLNEEQNRIGRALGQFADAKLLKKTLEFAMSKHVRIQDTAQIFLSVWANPLGKKIAWDFTKKNWQVLLKRYPSSGHILNRFIKPAANFSTEQEAKDVEKFFKSHKAPGAERAIEQVLEKIYTADAWLKRDGAKIARYLQL